MNCPIDGCRGQIFGVTGLQELNSLQSHMRRRHKTDINMTDALALREIAEAIDDGKMEPLSKEWAGPPVQEPPPNPERDEADSFVRKPKL